MKIIRRRPLWCVCLKNHSYVWNMKIKVSSISFTLCLIFLSVCTFGADNKSTLFTYDQAAIQNTLSPLFELEKTVGESGLNAEQYAQIHPEQTAFLQSICQHHNAHFPAPDNGNGLLYTLVVGACCCGCIAIAYVAELTTWWNSFLQ